MPLSGHVMPCHATPCPALPRTHLIVQMRPHPAQSHCSHFVTRDLQTHGKYVNLLGLRGEPLARAPPI